ncbi:MAG: choice-of-anchor L domain-containing protein [Acidobacteriota bacterium]
MKRILFFFTALAFISLLNFSGCKKSENPAESQPIQTNPTESFKVMIQSPSTEDYFQTTSDTASVSGTVIGSSNIKQVNWNSSSGANGTASGTTAWKTVALSLSKGDNTVAVTAIDNDNNSSSDTIIIVKNNSLLFKTLPQFSPSGVLQNSTTQVRVTIGIMPNQKLIDSTVKLFRVDSQNKIISEVAQLYDDGSLSHGDDIKGDRVFSALVYHNEIQTGMARLRVAAKIQQTPSPVTDYSGVGLLKVYAPVQEDKLNEVKTTQESAVTILNQNIANKDINQAITKAVEWLKAQPQVQSAEKIGSTVLIEYKSGLLGGLLIDEQDANGYSIYKGGETNADSVKPLVKHSIAKPRSEAPHIPVSLQTVGKYKRPAIILKGDTTLILNKKVLLYAPFDDAFPTSFATNALAKLKDSKLGLKNAYFANQSATVVVLQNLTDYGLVIIDSHGLAGQYILTGEIASAEKAQKYQDLLAPPKPQLAQFTNVVIKTTFYIFETKATVYGVNHNFIKGLLGKFPNSIIFNGSCQSTTTPFLEVEFNNKGAKTYLGFNKSVSVSFCDKVGTDFVKKLTVDEKKTGEAFTAGQTDPTDNTCVYQLKGNPEMHYTSGLINGDFEYGEPVAWDVTGDGRVINQLGSLTPPGEQYMGIISTGLGFALNRGTITQTFRIKPGQSTLSLKWNFLSEEFLEYIGSQYQDFFTITLIRENGTKIELLKYTIDQLAAKYGATKESPGSLIAVSPEIVFDRGGVYMTGWQDFSVDVSAYRDETLTIELSAGDVGDSVYDTAILLDNIEVK